MGALSGLLLLGTAVIAGSPAAGAQGADSSGTAAPVGRMLQKLVQLESFRFESETTRPVRGHTSAVTRHEVHGVRQQDTICWWDEKAGVLANRGPRWVVKDSGSWLASRHPTGAWRNAFLPDPVFLAEQLLGLLPRCRWRLGSEIHEDRVERFYRVELAEKETRRLIRSGALAGPGVDAHNPLVLLGGGAGVWTSQQDVEGTLEIRLYLDRTRIPTKIVARLFAKTQAHPLAVFAGGRGIVLRAGFGATPKKNAGEDAAEEPKKKKKDKKAALTTTITLRDIGTAKAALLDATARNMLAGRHPPEQAQPDKD